MTNCYKINQNECDAKQISTNASAFEDSTLAVDRESGASNEVIIAGHTLL